MHKLPSPDYLDLTYRPDLDLLVSRWLRHPTMAEMQHGYNLVLNTAATHQCVRWLVDARRRDHANRSSIPWMIETFYPQLATRLQGRVFMAYVYAPAHLQALEADIDTLSLSCFDGLPYQVGRFTDEQAALAWLESRCPGR